jgi:hypothetical protein
MGAPPAAANAGAENEKGGGAGPYPLSYQHGALINQPPFDTEDERPTNEYVLNVAFFSFLGFMILQSVFALMVNSESMLADSEAMVRCISLLLFACQSSFSQRRCLPQGRRCHDVSVQSLCRTVQKCSIFLTRTTTIPRGETAQTKNEAALSGTDTSITECLYVACSHNCYNA